MLVEVIVRERREAAYACRVNEHVRIIMVMVVKREYSVLVGVVSKNVVRLYRRLCIIGTATFNCVRCKGFNLDNVVKNIEVVRG